MGKERGKPEIAGEIIVQLIDHVVTPMNLPEIRAGLTLAVIDAVDRKIERDELEELVSDAIIFSEVGARVHTAAFLAQLQAEGKLNEEKLAEVITRLTKIGEHFRQKVVRRVGLQVQCPEPEDKIN